MTNGQSAGKSFAYLLGVYLGDGCVTRNGNRSVFRLNTIDDDFAQATKDALSNLTNSPVYISTHPVSKSSKPNHSLSCFDAEICEHLVSTTNAKQKLPETEYPLELIAGIMDSEGFVAANSNPTNRRYYMGYKSCDVWVPQFIRLLETNGIRVGKVSQEKPRMKHYKIPTRFTIKMQSWVDAGAYFNIKRKQERVQEWASAGPYERRARYPRRLTSETITLDPARG